MSASASFQPGETAVGSSVTVTFQLRALGRADHLRDERGGQPDERQPGPGRRVAAGGVHAARSACAARAAGGRCRVPATARPAGCRPTARRALAGSGRRRVTTCSRTSSPCRASDASRSSRPGPRPVTVQAWRPSGARPPVRTDEQRVAVHDQLVGQVAHLALEPHVAEHRRQRRRRARDQRRQRGQPARVDRADDDVGVEVSVGGGDRDRTTAADDDVVAAAAHDVDAAGAEPAYQRLQQYAGPAG